MFRLTPIKPPKSKCKKKPMADMVSIVDLIYNDNKTTMGRLLVAERINFDTEYQNAPGETPLFFAVRYGRADIVRMLLRNGASIENKQYSLPHLAVCYGHAKILKTLLHQYYIKHKCYPQSLLTYAVRSKQAAIVEMLLHNYELSATAADRHGVPLVVRAIEQASTKILSLLFDYGATFGNEIYNRLNVVVTVIQKGCVAILKMLIEHDKALLDERYTADHLSILFTAARSEHPGIMSLLIDTYRLNPHQLTSNYKNPFCHAIRFGRLAVVKMLVTKYKALDNITLSGYYKQTPLFELVVHKQVPASAIDGQAEILKFLLATKKIDVCHTDKSGCDIYSYAVMNNRPKIVEILLNSDYMMPIDNKKICEGLTPIRFAIREGFSKIVELFIKKDQDILHRKYATAQMSILFLAARTPYCSLLLLLLDEYKLSVKITDKNNKTPLFHAIRYGNLNTVKMLIDRYGASLYHRDMHKQTPIFETVVNSMVDYRAFPDGQVEVLEFLLDTYDININHVDATGRNILYYAVHNNYRDSIKILLKHNVLVNKLDIHRESPITVAIRTGLQEMLELLIDQDSKTILKQKYTENKVSILALAVRTPYIGIVKLLLKKYKIRLEILDQRRKTPLFYAVRFGQVNVVKVLVNDYGANVHCRDSYGQTPVFEAVTHSDKVGKNASQYLEILTFFLEIVKINVNIGDSFGRTIFFHAAKNNFIKAVEMLFEEKYNVDFNKMNKDSMTPYQATHKNRHFEMLKLLESNPQVNTKLRVHPS